MCVYVRVRVIEIVQKTWRDSTFFLFIPVGCSSSVKESPTLPVTYLYTKEENRGEDRGLTTVMVRQFMNGHDAVKSVVLRRVVIATH